MWFARKHHEYGCPMCGRFPKIFESQNQQMLELVTIYRLQCPRGHISTSWYSHPDVASSQWKRIIDEYNRQDTK